MKNSYILKQLSEIYAVASLSPSVIDIEMRGRNIWLLDSLFVVRGKRGRHYGSIILERVLRDADAEGVTLWLGVDPATDSPFTEYQLRSFYRRHGFVSLRSSINSMRRKPRGA